MCLFEQFIVNDHCRHWDIAQVHTLHDFHK